MVNSDLKDWIVSLRNSGKTFTEIQAILRDELGIARTRQGIQQIYAKECRKSAEILEVKDNVDDICDVVNLRVLGYSIDEIYEKLNKAIDKGSIIKILELNTDFYNEKYSALRALIHDSLKDNNSKSVILSKLEYKGNMITDTAFNKLICDVEANIAVEGIVDAINNAIELSGDNLIGHKVLKSISDKIRVY